jgi:two-component system response regulator AtoC
MGNRIIVVDDEKVFLESIRRGLITAGYKNVRMESDPKEAAALFERGETWDIALIDVTMPKMSGVELLELIRGHSPHTECIMVTAMNDATIAVECMKKGAYDYLMKPVSRDDLLIKIRHAEERKRLLDILDLKKRETAPELTNPKAFERIVTRSPRLLEILREAELHAFSNVPILITGESGTGKELLSRAIHTASPRAKSPFVPVNMASITSTLFDAEFFGHVRGAFTGAEKDRTGYLEHANQGTLFLDEIGILPIDLQGKLLRVLQEGEYARIGSGRQRKIDVRFIAATNEDLAASLARGTFRKDLYYRIKGALLHLPPLRERQEDIPLLIDRFLSELHGACGEKRIEEKAMESLLRYDYPGNIRELRSILQAAVNLAQGGPITLNVLPEAVRSRKLPSGRVPAPGSGPFVTLVEMEKVHILKIYAETGENKSRTARVLGLSLNTLRKKLKCYGVG